MGDGERKKQGKGEEEKRVEKDRGNGTKMEKKRVDMKKGRR